MKQLKKAKALAKKYHEGQEYRKVSYYEGHLERVASLLYPFKKKETVAYLHDILEDTDCSVKVLEENFDRDIVEAVILLTRDFGEKYDTYIKRVSTNSLARAVKKADLLSNLKYSVEDSFVGQGEARILKYTKALRILVQTDIKEGKKCPNCGDFLERRYPDLNCISCSWSRREYICDNPDCRECKVNLFSFSDFDFSDSIASISIKCNNCGHNHIDSRYGHPCPACGKRK